MHIYIYIYMCIPYTVEPQSSEPSGNKSVRKSKISVTLLTSRFYAVLYIFHEECAAMITIKHNLAYIEAKALRY